MRRNQERPRGHVKTPDQEDMSDAGDGPDRVDKSPASEEDRLGKRKRPRGYVNRPNKENRSDAGDDPNCEDM